MKVDIRAETNDDMQAIFQINKKAFGRDAESRLVNALRATPAYVPALSLVAKHAGTPVGHILFYPVQIRAGETTTHVLALAPMAVLPSFQRKGIGGKLVKVGLAKAKKLGFGAVVVYGRTQYYPRFGFQSADVWGITASFAGPENALMAIELVPGALAVAAGTISYPPAFNAV